MCEIHAKIKVNNEHAGGEKMQKTFDAQLREAITQYGDDHIDIAVYEGEDKVYGFYHSRHNSFGVTDDYSLTQLGGIEQIKQYEEEFEGLCVCEED